MTSSDLLNALKTHFDLDSFRSSAQEAAVKCAVSGSGYDLFVSMPTGSGKSLVFQLPGVMAAKGKVTIVVSPLIALIKVCNKMLIAVIEIVFHKITLEFRTKLKG